jgi:carbonic anhydrase/acetyltransferase-like protein (isoleucine patch superfamily)
VGRSAVAARCLPEGRLTAAPRGFAKARLPVAARCRGTPVARLLLRPALLVAAVDQATVAAVRRPPLIAGGSRCPTGQTRTPIGTETAIRSRTAIGTGAAIRSRTVFRAKTAVRAWAAVRTESVIRAWATVRTESAIRARATVRTESAIRARATVRTETAVYALATVGTWAAVRTGAAIRAGASVARLRAGATRLAGTLLGQVVGHGDRAVPGRFVALGRGGGRAAAVVAVGGGLRRVRLRGGP